MRTLLRNSAFTLIEILGAIGIAGVLMALIVPCAAGAVRSTARARTLVQWAEWGALIEAFQSGQGRYPEPAETRALCAGSGDSAVAVLVDRNADGTIDAADYPQLPGVRPPDAPDLVLRPGLETFPASGVKAGVLVYGAPAGARDPAGLLLSWK